MELVQKICHFGLKTPKTGLVQETLTEEDKRKVNNSSLVKLDAREVRDSARMALQYLMVDLESTPADSSGL